MSDADGGFTTYLVEARARSLHVKIGTAYPSDILLGPKNTTHSSERIFENASYFAIYTVYLYPRRHLLQLTRKNAS
jgi:hypothetical protein